MNSAVLWYASRATGIVLLVLLSATLVMGIVIRRRGSLPGLPRFATTGLHRNAALLAIVLLAVHVLTAVLDSYVDIGWTSAVVPLTSSYERYWLAVGTVSLDLMLAITVTSLLRRHLPAPLWRAVHWSAYLVFPLAAIHGIGAAADLQSGTLLALAIGCIAVVTAAAGWNAWALWRQPRGTDRVTSLLTELQSRRPIAGRVG